jgi:hypothetical protein
MPYKRLSQFSRHFVSPNFGCLGGNWPFSTPTPASPNEFSAKVPGPAYSVLGNRKLKSQNLNLFRSLQDGLHAYLSEKQLAVAREQAEASSQQQNSSTTNEKLKLMGPSGIGAPLKSILVPSHEIQLRLSIS